MTDDKFNKNDSGKLKWTLLPWSEVEEVVKVLMNGSLKYGCDNWKKCDDVNRYKDALQRHVVAYLKGEKIDDVSKGGDGLPHLAHAICNCLFLLYMDHHSEEDSLAAEFEKLKNNPTYICQVCGKPILEGEYGFMYANKPVHQKCLSEINFA